VVDPWKALDRVTEALRLSLPASFESHARRYLEELARWSRVTRLTGYATVAERVEHLVVESVAMLAVLGDWEGRLLDIGTGNGAPGLILQLARPDRSVVLAEANRRRANFLRHLVRELRLDSTEVREARAETLAGEVSLRAAFQVVTMRAVAAPSRSMTLARPFLASAGWLVMPLSTRRPAPAVGRTNRVAWPGPGPGLSRTRTFLIIRGDELGADVPRETRG
jgi:16S rRNA (guanine527-N7)-methyltransferase